MKLRLVLETKTKKGHEVDLKFNIAPSKHIGFINFVNLALKHGKPVTLSFEKVSKNKKEESKIEGNFLLVQKGEESQKQLEELEKEIRDEEKRRKKQSTRRKAN